MDENECWTYTWTGAISFRFNEMKSNRAQQSKEEMN